MSVADRTLHFWHSGDFGLWAASHSPCLSKAPNPLSGRWSATYKQLTHHSANIAILFLWSDVTPLPHSRHVAATLRSSFSSFIAIPTRPVCFNNSSPSFLFSPTIYMFDTYVDFSTTFYTQCSQLVIKEFKWSARVCGAAAILQLRLWEDLHCSATGDRSPAFCSVSSGLANALRWEMVRLGAVSWIRTQCKDFISWQCQFSPQCHDIFQYNHLHLGAAALLSLPGPKNIHTSFNLDHFWIRTPKN